MPRSFISSGRSNPVPLPEDAGVLAVHVDDHGLSVLDLAAGKPDLGMLPVDDPGQVPRAARRRLAADHEQVGRPQRPADLHGVGCGAGGEPQRALPCEVGRCCPPVPRSRCRRAGRGRSRMRPRDAATCAAGRRSPPHRRSSRSATARSPRRTCARDRSARGSPDRAGRGGRSS